MGRDIGHPDPPVATPDLPASIYQKSLAQKHFFECMCIQHITIVTNIAMVQELDSRPQQKAGVGVDKRKRICWEAVMESLDNGHGLCR